MSVSTFFAEECFRKIQENAQLIVEKLADPASLVSFSAEGALVDAAAGGLGGLANFAEDYLRDNAATLITSAIGVTGEENIARQFLNLAYNTISAAITANNDLVLMFVKVVAREAVIALDEKEEILLLMQEKFRTLYNTLVNMNAGDPVFEQYIADLREALILIDSASTNLDIVAGTLQTSNFFLDRTFQSAKDQLAEARELTTPLADNPYFEPTFNAVLTNAGLPTVQEQKANMVAITRLSKQVIDSSRGYFVATLKANAIISAYQLAVDSFSENVLNVLARWAISLIDENNSQLKTLVENMADILNGDINEIDRPVDGFSPEPITVSAQTYKWQMILEIVANSLETVPDSQLTNINLSNSAVATYQESVDTLKGIDDYTNRNAIVPGEDGTEDVGTLETQLLTFMLAANAAVTTASVDESVLALGRSVLDRFTLTLERDADVKAALNSFISAPINAEQQLQEITDGVFKLLDDAGLDRAAEFLKEGAFGDFFNLDAKSCTFVGAALVAVAQLKECFPTVEEQQELTVVQRELEQAEDLLTLKLAFNFDLAIFQNIQDCLRLEGLSITFFEKETFCGIIESSGIGSAFNALNDLVSF
jgi:hypothetical protein